MPTYRNILSHKAHQKVRLWIPVKLKMALGNQMPQRYHEMGARNSNARHVNINVALSFAVVAWHIKYHPQLDDLNIAYAHEVDGNACNRFKLDTRHRSLLTYKMFMRLPMG